MSDGIDELLRWHFISNDSNKNPNANFEHVIYVTLFDEESLAELAFSPFFNVVHNGFRSFIK